MIRNYVVCPVEPPCTSQIQYLSLKGYSSKNSIEGTLTVGCYENQFFAEIIGVSDFASALIPEIIICFT